MFVFTLGKVVRAPRDFNSVVGDHDEQKLFKFNVRHALSQRHDNGHIRRVGTGDILLLLPHYHWLVLGGCPEFACSGKGRISVANLHFRDIGVDIFCSHLVLWVIFHVSPILA